MKPKSEDYPTVVKDMLYNINTDRYMWCVIWGEPRVGKSTLALLLLYFIYRNWSKVLNAVTFSLGQTIYKIKHNLPELWPVRGKDRRRVPALLWDDFGAHSNKASTQHDPTWDKFKGGFDVLGTRIGVLMATMVEPTEPTQQLQNKYTHELWISSRGKCKYDRYHTQQDFKGFKTKGRKTWIDDFEFGEVPKEVFSEYEEMRQELADEVILSIEDTMVDTQLEYVMKRLDNTDIKLLKMILDYGPIYHDKVYSTFGKDLGKKMLTRLKTRNVISPVSDPKTGYRRYDLNELGVEILKAVTTKSTESTISTHID